MDSINEGWVTAATTNKNHGPLNLPLNYAYIVFTLEIVLAFYWIALMVFFLFWDHEHLVHIILFGLHYPGLIALSGILDSVTEKKNSLTKQFVKKPKLHHHHHHHHHQNSAPTRVTPINTVHYRDENGNDRTVHYTSMGGVGMDNMSSGDFLIPMNENDPTRSTWMRTNASDLAFKHYLEQETFKQVSKVFKHFPIEYAVALFISAATDIIPLINCVKLFVESTSGDTHEARVVFILDFILFGVGTLLTVTSTIWSLYTYLLFKRHQ